MASPPMKGSDFVQRANEQARQRKEAAARHWSRVVEFFQSDVLYKEFDLPDLAAAEREQSAVALAFAGVREPSPNAPDAASFPDGIRILLACPSKTCQGAERTLACTNTQQSVPSIPLGTSGNITFLCAQCGEYVSFLVHARRNGDTCSLVKAGQWPSLRPRPDSVLARALGADAGLYAQGMAAERAGFGIGAYAYYRQVAENVTDELLAKLMTFAEGSGNTAMVAAIQAVGAEQQASKKIDAVKDLLPPMLREGGLNPLGTIYGALSDHLHSRTDAECLHLAGDLRGALEFLLRTLEGQQIEKERYEASIRKVQATQAERAKKTKGT